MIDFDESEEYFLIFHLNDDRKQIKTVTQLGKERVKGAIRAIGRDLIPCTEVRGN